jgi:export-related chaperone CsaA
VISLDDFQAVDMRVGRVLAVDDFPEARRPAWKLEIDFGPEIGVKRSSAQIKHYARDALVGRLVVGVVNFPPLRMGSSSEPSTRRRASYCFARMKMSSQATGSPERLSLWSLEIRPGWPARSP